MCLEQDQIKRFWSKVNKEPGQGPNGDCWQWTAGEKNREGYGGFYIRQINNTVNCHKLSFLLAHNFGLDDIPDGIVIRHKCNNAKCVHPEHLALGTYKDNSQDMVAAGNSCCAERGGNTKITWDVVRALRADWLTGNFSYSDLGRKYDLSGSQARQIAKNLNWVDDNYKPDDCKRTLSHRLKFGDDVVVAVREERAAGRPAKETAAKHGMSISQYYNIIRGDQRKGVGGE